MEKTVYVVAHWNKYSKEFEYSVRGYKLSEGSEDVMILETAVTFETPVEKELKGQLVIALRGKKAKIFEDAAQEAKEVDEVIQELLAIEDKSQDTKAKDNSDLHF